MDTIQTSQPYPLTENQIIAALDEINEQIERLRPDESAEPLNRARRHYEAELAALRVRRRTANLTPRFAQIFAASPLVRPVLEAPETSLEREGREENLRIKKTDKGYINPFDEIHEWDLQQDAERDARAAREEACQE